MVKLICYNIEYCEGILGKWWQYLELWKIFFPPKKLNKRIIRAFKRFRPDILALVEVDVGSLRNRFQDEVKFLEDRMQLNDFTELVKYPLKSWVKLFHHVPILDKQANAIISKYKLEKVKYHVFHEGTKRMVIEATINCPQKVTLLLAHLALGKKARAKQIHELIKIVNDIKNPVILMGDFNTFNGESEIKDLLKKTHLKNRTKLDNGAKIFTEPAWHPSKRLDYVLTSPKLKINRYTVLKFHYSDHLPLYVEFEMK